MELNSLFDALKEVKHFNETETWKSFKVKLEAYLVSRRASLTFNS